MKQKKNEERKREIKQQLMKNELPHKATLSNITDLDISLFDAELKTGITWDSHASTAWRSTLKSAMTPTCYQLPKPAGHPETQDSSLSLEDCSPQPCSLLSDHFNQLVLNTQTRQFGFQSSSIKCMVCCSWGKGDAGNAAPIVCTARALLLFQSTIGRFEGIFPLEITHLNHMTK